MFLRRLREAQARETYASEHWSVLYLDLDGFKVVNDSLGHDAGDDLLVAAAQRLRQCTPPTAVVARMGGDEFAILQGPSRVLAPELTAAMIVNAMQQPFHVGGHKMVVTPSIGIVSGTESDEADELLRYADSAMYEAKHRGKGQYAIFDRAMASRATERFRLEIDLRNALERSEFTLHYQPIVDLHTGDVEGVEALIRWQHPERGRVSPGEFIPLAEETGLIVPIGRWVLREACAQLCAWQARFPERANWHINVNLSMPQIKDSSLVDDVAQVLRETRLSPHLLQLELTETSLAQGLEATTKTLSELKALGVGLVIDDFGMGYSSLNYLRWFPVDIVKVDRTFIAGLGQNPTDMAIVQAVIAVAKSLGLQVTGEGIETAEQLAFLRDLHCDRGQGYYLSHPCPPEALDQSLRALQAL
jgi:diguanylate cyclase (GGDEF)-like protein